MMKGGLGNIMKQAQAMQENLRKAQEELAHMEVMGSAGGGMVSVVMTCRHDVRAVKIDPQLLQDDREVLEDLVAAAVNDAVRKVEQTVQQKMSGLTAGLNIPGLNLPF
jgi:DNA-binding YbaB/EbfC family protein